MAIALGVLLLIVTPKDQAFSSGTIGENLLQSSDRLVVGFFFFLPIGLPISTSRLFFYAVLLMIYVGCFYAAFVADGGFRNNLREAIVQHQFLRVPNWLLVMPLVASGLLLVVIGLTFLQEWFGVPTGVFPEKQPFEMLYELSYSPVLEEWTFRMTTLGLFTALRVFQSSHSLSPIALSFLVPDKAKEQVGLPSFRRFQWKSFHWSDWVGLVSTSLIFGLAHIVGGGSSWEVGKVATASLSGAVLGVVFLIYGGYAAIMLHWFFNFYFVVFQLVSENLGGVFETTQVAISFLTLGTGVIGLTTALVMIWKRRFLPQ